MKYNTRFKAGLFLILLFGLFGMAHKGLADEIGFRVSPGIPSNQMNSNKSSWDILLNPGETQTLYVEITNDTDKELKLKTDVANATTNLRGQVQYSKATSAGSKVNPKVDYTKNVKIDSDIKVGPKATVKVPVEVTMINESFKGLAAGGVSFYQDPATIETKPTEKKGMTIKNQYKYILTLIMRQHGQEDIVPPSLTLNKVAAESQFGQTVVNATFENNQPAYLGDMFMTTNITGPQEIKYQDNQMMMAPNTTFKYPIPTTSQATNYQPIKAGDYKMNVVVYGRIDPEGKYKNIKTPDGKTQNYRYRWEFNESFKITGSEAAKLNNENAFNPNPNRMSPWIWALALIPILLLIALWVLFRKNEVIVQDSKTHQYLVSTDKGLVFEGQTVSEAMIFRNKRKAKQAVKHFENFIIIELKQLKNRGRRAKG